MGFVAIGSEKIGGETRSAEQSDLLHVLLVLFSKLWQHRVQEITDTRIKKKSIIFESKADKNTEDPQKPIKKPVVKEVKKPYSPKYLAKAEGEDAASYDFVAKRPPGDKAKLPEAIAHLTSNSLSATLYCLCELYSRSGSSGAVMTNICMAILMSYTSYILTRSAQKVYGITKVPQMTYPDLAQAAMDLSTYNSLRKYGGQFKCLVVAVIVANLIGKCCLNQLVLARSIEKIFFGTFLNPEKARGFLAVLVIPFVMMGMVRTIDNIGPFMFASHFFSLILGMTISNPTIDSLMAVWQYLTMDEVFRDVMSFFSLWGGCAFAIDNTRAVLTVENSMEAPTKIYKVIISGMLISSALTTTYNLLSAVITDGAKIYVPVIFIAFKIGAPFAATYLFSLCFIALISHALDFHIMFNLVSMFLKKKHPKEKYRKVERLYRAFFVLGITIIALIFPDINFIMSFFGSLTSGVLNFIIPPIIEFLVDTRNTGLGKCKWKLMRLLVIVLPGVIMIIGGIIASVYNVLINVYKVKFS